MQAVTGVVKTKFDEHSSLISDLEQRTLASDRKLERCISVLERVQGVTPTDGMGKVKKRNAK